MAKTKFKYILGLAGIRVHIYSIYSAQPLAKVMESPVSEDAHSVVQICRKKKPLTDVTLAKFISNGNFLALGNTKRNQEK